MAAPSSPPPDWAGALARAEAHAPFLARAMARREDLTGLLAAGKGEAALAQARLADPDAPDTPDLATCLRRARLATALVLAIGDLAGAFSLDRVMAELSALAARALHAAILHAIAAHVPSASLDPDGKGCGFVALALGKLGAGELNYSSDIDLILLYDPATLPHRPREEAAEAAEAIARGIVRLLAHIDAEGYVFRVDLRLRPASEVSPLALPIMAALSHYEGAGLTWERAAFIRARAIAGDHVLGAGFLDHIRPFVWRKSLDFGAIAEIGRLTARIRASGAGARIPGPGFDIKRGKGGIREIEFFAQTHQLIHGGRNPALRQRGTRASLNALAAAGIITPEDAATMSSACARLRSIEHRLQMQRDLQTHSLPRDAADLDAVARLDGLDTGEALIAEVAAITATVSERYDHLLAASPGAVPASSPPRGQALAEELGRLGYANPAALAARIEGWRGGRIRALRSEAALTALDAVQPALLAALARAPSPETALHRCEQVLENLPSAVNLLRLLAARPALLTSLARILTLAPPLADALARRADLLDPLIDARPLPGDVATLVADFAAHEADDDYQRLLDSVRRKVGEARFMLGVALIEHAADPLAIAARLAHVAEAALVVLARATIAQFEAVHGRVPGGELVVLGLGRLGGGMLSHASDLDLIYLFTGDHASESDGARPLGATAYFNRLAARVSAALSVPTAEGALYVVDTRLRPQGEQGLLAASTESFARYHRDEAWAWEHMALARARVVLGGAAARAELGGIIAQTLRLPRDHAKLREDVLAMRAKIAAHKPPKGTIDVKHLRGGLIDIEFIVHFLQLQGFKGCDDGIDAALTPDLAAAVAALVARGALPEGITAALALMTRLLVAARLIAPDGAAPSSLAARSMLAKTCHFGDWEALLVALAEACAAVIAAWGDVFDAALADAL